MTPLPILVSIPHGGSAVPPELVSRTCLSPADIFDDGDACTGDLYGVESVVRTVYRATVARACVDLNRAPDDLPPENPDGVVKSVTCYGRPVYRKGLAPDAALVARLVERYHAPYHASLAAATASGTVRLALDCHSMAAVAPPTARDAGTPRPLFCVSNGDGDTCPPHIMEQLVEALGAVFQCEARDIGINRPFQGGYITRTHGRGETPWVQLEMNRSLYLGAPWFDRATRQVDAERLSLLRSRFADVLRRLRL